MTSFRTEHVRQFLKDGFTRITPSMTFDEHAKIYWQTDNIFKRSKGYNPLNNVLPMVPDLYKVLEDPNVVNAITALLGPNYLVHPHRHCHTNFPSINRPTPAMLQGFHKDGHAHRARPRHREPRWLIMFYSPQTTPLKRGPTAVMPGSHLLPRLAKKPHIYDAQPVAYDDNNLRLPDMFHVREISALSGEPSVALCHFDIGHAAMVNATVLPRYVHKFVLMRTEVPSMSDIQINTDDPLEAHLASWMGWQAQLEPKIQSFNEWKEAVKGCSLRERISAIYDSGRFAKEHPDLVRSVLLEDIENDLDYFQADEVLNIADAVNGLAVANDEAGLLELINSDIPAKVATGCFGAGQARSVVSIPFLLERLHHENDGVRKHSISALGIIVGETNALRGTTLERLDALFDELDDWDQRFFIVQALVRLGPTEDTIPLLSKAVKNRNAYVSSYAMEQLCRIDSDEARRIVLSPLRKQRWFAHEYVTAN